MSATIELFLGWDVGAWNCDKNPESRDALCALVVDEHGPRVAGRIWRSNLRDDLVTREGSNLVEALLNHVGMGQSKHSHLTLAIDTPLAWPRRMLDLVTKGTTVVVPREADSNPYLFRVQELALFSPGCRPLSAVRDMIGSQSTKGIHFLQRAKLAPSEIGVWTDTQRRVVAIETYPAAAVRDVETAQLTSRVFADYLAREKKSQSAAWQRDARDALTCALVAYRHRLGRPSLRAPGAEATPDEGWIWLPGGTDG